MQNRFLTTPWPALIWTGLIFFLLTIKTGTMESVPLLGIRNIDKLVHVALFAVFVWLWCSYLLKPKTSSKRIFFAMILVGIAYGAGMEFYQDHFTTREFELADIFADAAGAVIGAVYFWIKNKPLWK
jgi:VanZ family protein